MANEKDNPRNQSNEFPKIAMPQRALLVIHSMRGGGSERQFSYLANELSQQFHTTLVTLDDAGDDGYALSPRVSRVGLGLIDHHGGPIRGSIANMRRVWALRQEIQRVDPDIVISFCDTNNILTLLACPSSIPVLISERSDPRHQRLSRMWETLRSYAYPKCRACVVQTDEMRDYFAATGLVAAEKTTVIPSAIQIPSHPKNYATSKIDSPKTLIYVGRLSKEKRVDRLIDAWASLRHHHEYWQLNIVGDGPERENLQKQAEHLGLSGTLVWSKWCENPWQQLRSSDAYCLVSQYEGFPQSMLEAMACGLPVAVLNCSPAIGETIQHEKNGLVIANESEIVSNLNKLLSDRQLRATLGTNASHRSKDFLWDKLAVKWLDVIRRCMD